MLIIEGTDLVGKTTLAQTLTKRLAYSGYVYSHFTRLPRGFDYCWDYIARASRRVVQDRFHMSEWAYSQARDDPEPSPLSCEKYRVIDGYLRSIGAFTVVILAEESLIRSRLGREEMYDIDVILKAQNSFKYLTTTRACDYDLVIKCDERNPWPDDQRILSAYLARQEAIDEIVAAKTRRSNESIFR